MAKGATDAKPETLEPWAAGKDGPAIVDVHEPGGAPSVVEAFWLVDNVRDFYRSTPLDDPTCTRTQVSHSFPLICSKTRAEPLKGVGFTIIFVSNFHGHTIQAGRYNLRSDRTLKAFLGRLGRGNVSQSEIQPFICRVGGCRQPYADGITAGYRSTFGG
jgi:hypothetical protein